jgi:hypothetical protein
MSEERSLERHFEAILGRDLVPDLDREIAVRELVSVYSRESGFRVSRDTGTTGSVSKGCAEHDGVILEVSGFAVTGADGMASFLLSDFHCDLPVSTERPVNLVATPRSRTPVFLTSEPSIVPGDVQITVRAWNVSGVPAAGIAFDWRCRIPLRPTLT